jgi:hypothetical protein
MRLKKFSPEKFPEWFVSGLLKYLYNRTNVSRAAIAPLDGRQPLQLSSQYCAVLVLLFTALFYRTFIHFSSPGVELVTFSLIKVVCTHCFPSCTIKIMNLLTNCLDQCQNLFEFHYRSLLGCCVVFCSFIILIA